MEKEIERIIRSVPTIGQYHAGAGEAARLVAEWMKEDILVEAMDVYVWNKPHWGWELTIKEGPIHSVCIIDDYDWKSVYQAGRLRGHIVVYREKQNVPNKVD